MSAAAARAARELIAGCYDGVLATISVEVAGYPFGSVVPYCLDRAARPVILIASIAQHTRNLNADPRTSLTVFERSAADVQAAARATVLGDVERLSPGAARDAAAERYFRYFPDAAAYDRTHDFAFHAIVPRRVRFIGGFGDIHWFDPGAVHRANPFDGDAERAIVEHMNNDHSAAIRHYCTLRGIALPAGADPVLVGCDGDGIDVRVGLHIARIAFPAPVNDLAGARAALVAMARAVP